MSTAAQQAKDDAQALRRAGGAWLKARREAAGLSQRELAVRIDIDYYTFISQLESGRGRVPVDRYEKYALAIGVVPRVFALTMLRYHEPVLFQLIFAGDAPGAGVSGLDAHLLRLGGVVAV